MSTSIFPGKETGVIEVNNDDDDTTDIHFAKDIRFNGDSQLVWTDADADPDALDKVYQFNSATDQGAYIELQTDTGTVHVRDLDPYDGVIRSGAGVPQPLEVMQAEVLRGGGVVAQELSAVVAPDNNVVTLMLETGLGVYVRFSGDWQLLTGNSSALDDCQIIPVSPAAIDVFDKADAANIALSAFDLPRDETFDDGSTIQVTPEPVSMRDSGSTQLGGTMVASGTMIPPVESLDDLDVAVRVASANPAARWFVAKRAKVMGPEAMERVPADWFPQAVVRPFVR